MKKILYVFIPVLFLVGIKWFAPSSAEANAPGGVYPVKLVAPEGKAIAAFAEGCFWHSEIIFEAVTGVDSAIAGYAGGKTKDPSYNRIETGTTGHAETVLVYYDPKKVSYKTLLQVYYLSHDPEQVNGQGNDRGTQYRSIVFYGNEAEHKLALSARQQINASGKKAATEIDALSAFYRAEEYHQNYIPHHPDNAYVRNVSIPEYKAFRKAYTGSLKKDLIR